MEIKLTIKMTTIETNTTYTVKHFELDEEKVIKDFGSLEEFEQYEDLLQYLMDEEEVDNQIIDGEPSDFTYYNGHQMVNTKGRMYEVED